MKRKLKDIISQAGILLISFLIVCLSGCAKVEKMVFFNPDEVTRLLSGDTVKSWTRVSVSIDGVQADITECELRRIYTYEVFDDSLAYRVNSDPEFCENGSIEISRGEWSVLTLPTNNQIANRIRIIQGSDTLIKEIREITALFMTLESSAGEESIAEGYAAIR